MELVSGPELDLGVGEIAVAFATASCHFALGVQADSSNESSDLLTVESPAQIVLKPLHQLRNQDMRQLQRQLLILLHSARLATNLEQAGVG